MHDNSTESQTDIPLSNPKHYLKTSETVLYSTAFKHKATISNESDSKTDGSMEKTDQTLSVGLGPTDNRMITTSRTNAAIDHDRADILADNPKFKTSGKATSATVIDGALNEDDVIAELQNIIEQEEMNIESTSSSVSLICQETKDSSRKKDGSEKDGSHEKLLSDNDINSEIKLLSDSLSDDSLKPLVHDTCEVLHAQSALQDTNRSYQRVNTPCAIETSRSQHPASDKRILPSNQLKFDQHANKPSYINSTDELSEHSSIISSDDTTSSVTENIPETISRPGSSFSRPGSPLGFMRPIRTSFSANTLAYLQNKKLDDASETTGMNMKIESIINRSRPGSPTSNDDIYTLHSESDELSDTVKPNSKSPSSPSDTNKNITLTDLSPDYNATYLEASPEVVDTSSLLPDQRPYYRTVIVDPLSPETSFQISGDKSYSASSSQNLSETCTESSQF